MIHPNNEEQYHSSAYTRFGDDHNGSAYKKSNNTTTCTQPQSHQTFLPRLDDHNQSPPQPLELTTTMNFNKSSSSNNKNNNRSNEARAIEIDDYDYDDEEIQRDAASNTVALVVYIALGFFMTLFLCVTVAILIIVGQYGFVVFMMLSVLVFIVAMLIKVIMYFFEEDRVLRPMKKKMRRWHAIATAVVVNELKNFHLDLNDHLLLTYDENYQDDNHNEDSADKSNVDDNGGRRRKWRGGGGARIGTRSKIFGLLVQPLLKKKNGQNRFGKRKKKENTAVVDGVTFEDHAFV